PLDRLRDAGAARQPGGEPAHGTVAAPGQLSPGVSARLGQQNLLHATATRSAAAGQRGRGAPDAAWRRRASHAPHPAVDRPHRGQPILSGRERAHAVGAPGAYRLVQPLDTFHVPATVQAVLAARMDRLPPEEKRLLQTAAVIGT